MDGFTIYLPSLSAGISESNQNPAAPEHFRKPIKTLTRCHFVWRSICTVSCPEIFVVQQVGCEHTGAAIRKPVTIMGISIHAARELHFSGSAREVNKWNCKEWASCMLKSHKIQLDLAAVTHHHAWSRTSQGIREEDAKQNGMTQLLTACQRNRHKP